MPTALFLYFEQRGADFLIAVKHCRHKGFQVIKDRLTYGRKAPLQVSKRERKHRRDITWTVGGDAGSGVGGGELAWQRHGDRCARQGQASRSWPRSAAWPSTRCGSMASGLSPRAWPPWPTTSRDYWSLWAAWKLVSHRVLGHF
jgi:hypothetical protein